MITRYSTINGGVYEVDDTEKKFRKVTGGAHTASIPMEWSPYREVHYPLYERLVIEHNLRTVNGVITTGEVAKVETVNEDGSTALHLGDGN